MGSGAAQLTIDDVHGRLDSLTISNCVFDGGNADIALHQISFKDVFVISWRPDGAARAATRRIVRGPRPLSATGLQSAAQGSEKSALREIV